MHQDNSVWLTPTHSRLNGPNPRIYIKSSKQNSKNTTSLYISFISNIDLSDQNESSHGNSPTCSIHILKTAYRRPLISANSSTGYKDLNLRFRENEIAPLEEVICCFGNFVEERAYNQIASEI